MGAASGSGPPRTRILGQSTCSWEGPVGCDSGPESGGKIKGNFSVLQTRWGIKPYTAMLGALKVADRVDVEFEVNAPA